jgi:hypothetical protein
VSDHDLLNSRTQTLGADAAAQADADADAQLAALLAQDPDNHTRPRTRKPRAAPAIAAQPPPLPSPPPVPDALVPIRVDEPPPRTVFLPWSAKSVTAASTEVIDLTKDDPTDAEPYDVQEEDDAQAQEREQPLETDSTAAEPYDVQEENDAQAQAQALPQETEMEAAGQAMVYAEPVPLLQAVPATTGHAARSVSEKDDDDDDDDDDAFVDALEEVPYAAALECYWSVRPHTRRHAYIQADVGSVTDGTLCGEGRLLGLQAGTGGRAVAGGDERAAGRTGLGCRCPMDPPCQPHARPRLGVAAGGAVSSVRGAREEHRLYR